MKRRQATRRHEYKMNDWERPLLRSEVVLLFAAAGGGIVLVWFLLVWLLTL
jgi:hypothetical protein